MSADAAAQDVGNAEIDEVSGVEHLDERAAQQDGDSRNTEDEGWLPALETPEERLMGELEKLNLHDVNALFARDPRRGTILHPSSPEAARAADEFAAYVRSRVIERLADQRSGLKPILRCDDLTRIARGAANTLLEVAERDEWRSAHRLDLTSLDVCTPLFQAGPLVRAIHAVARNCGVSSIPKLPRTPVTPHAAYEWLCELAAAAATPDDVGPAVGATADKNGARLPPLTKQEVNAMIIEILSGDWCASAKQNPKSITIKVLMDEVLRRSPGRRTSESQIRTTKAWKVFVAGRKEQFPPKPRAVSLSGEVERQAAIERLKLEQDAEKRAGNSSRSRGRRASP